MAKADINETQILNLSEQNFSSDKEFLLEKTAEYLKENRDAPRVKNTEMNKPLLFARSEITEAINRGNLDEALKNLEKLRDLKTGITHKEISNADNTRVLIRDARNCAEKPVRSTEAFEMQYLNALRAASEIAELEDPRNVILLNDLREKNNNFTKIIEEKKLEGKNLSKKELQELSKSVKNEIKNIAKTMEKNGIKDCYKTLNDAKDFQNFNNIQANIVTISKIGTHTIIEAEVGFRKLTDEQKQEYQNIAAGKDQPKWFEELPIWQQKLLSNKYAKIIAEGKHVIPTQLRQIAGMRNAFEKTTAILKNEETDNDKLKIIHTSKHAGTLASLNKDKKASKAIAIANAMQAKIWIGANKILHCNTLNAGVIGSGDDPKIVSDTKETMGDPKIGGRITNTSFNAFRLFGIANNYEGVKNTLENIAQTIANNDDQLKTHIMPRSVFQRLFGLNKPKGNIDDMLNKIDNQELKAIYKNAIALRKSVEKADVPFRLFFDGENVNAELSARLNLLTNKIAKNSQLLPTLVKEEMLVMCASGKDRTGLSMHDQTAQAIAAELKIDIRDIDRELIRNGHTAQQAGGINAGGGTIGCFGTKKENKAGIPKSRMKNLILIIEASASTNKVKGKAQPITQVEKEKINASNIAANQPAVHMEQKNNQLVNNRKKLVSNSINIKSPTQPIMRKAITNSKRI